MTDTVYGLTCNHSDEPRGIDSTPVLSWKIDAEAAQTAYQIGVCSSLQALAEADYDIWDSGQVTSADSRFIPYAGPALKPRTTYHWQVTVTLDDGSTATEESAFETGKLSESWSARWIAAAHQTRPDDALDAPYLRRAFELPSEPLSARLYICSPGYFDAYINNQRVADEELPTPFTKFDRRLLYCTYDVTSLLQTGANAIGALIGNGWYNCFTDDVWDSRQAVWRHIPKLIAELHVDCADGSHHVVHTDGTWKSSKSPITFNGIRHGERYDASLEQAGWAEAGFDDAEWGDAAITRPTGGLLEAMEMEPIRVTSTITAVKSWQTPEGAYVFDAGQNISGIARITVAGSAGDEIVVRYSEQLAEDGVEINQKTVSGFVRNHEFQTDRYVKGTDGAETWQPRFVYHGFQFIEVTGASAQPTVEALVVHTDVADSGSFVSNDDTLNAVQHAARWATLTNLHGIPTDDPHREKNAWTGDVSLSAEQMLLNFHTTPLLRKWLTDIRDAQKADGALPCVVPSTGWGYNWGNGPDWSSALTHIPWQIYLYTGDRRVLSENYEAITRHFGYMQSMAVDDIVHYGIGDWCPPFEGAARLPTMSSFKTPVEVTDTAYYYNAADTIARMATVLDKPDDAQHYAAAAQQIKAAFRKAFYDADSQQVAGDCQTATACMIYQGLCEEDEKGALLDVLLQQIEATDFHQDTGILGNKYLYNVLGAAGRMDVALKMVLNETYPSYRHWIDMGATTLFECWNGEGSRNHHMFSDIAAVFYKYLGGIRPDESEPGFRHILMAPSLDCGLTSVQCRHESPLGPVVCDWEITGDSARLDIQIPSGCRASLTLPAAFGGSDQSLSAGTHQITVERTA